MSRFRLYSGSLIVTFLLLIKQRVGNVFIYLILDLHSTKSIVHTLTKTRFIVKMSTLFVNYRINYPVSVVLWFQSSVPDRCIGKTRRFEFCTGHTVIYTRRMSRRRYLYEGPSCYLPLLCTRKCSLRGVIPQTCDGHTSYLKRVNLSLKIQTKNITEIAVKDAYK